MNNPQGLFRKSLPDYFPPQQEVEELHSQITKVGVHVDVDAPKGQDLAKIMEEMRAKYEKIALNNQEELKKWHDSQVICQCQDLGVNKLLLSSTYPIYY